MSAIAYVWPCRWSGHFDWQHDIPPGITLDLTQLAPCRVAGCECDDYEDDGVGEDSEEPR